MVDSLLSRIGFRRNWIYETVVTTSPRHSAPIGVWTTDFRSLKLRVYKKSRTLENILENKYFVVNFPENVLDFQKALSSKPVRGLNHLKMRVTSEKQLKDSVEFKAAIVGHRLKKNVRLFNRGEALALEYLIKKTKPKPGRKELSEYRRVINKVAPNSIYSKIVK